MARIKQLSFGIGSMRPRIGQGKKQADAHYTTPAHEAWALAVKERDGFACVDPRHDPAKPRHGVKLYADHVQEIKDAPHLALVVANGRTLCAACHGRKTHAMRQARQRQPY